MGKGHRHQKNLKSEKAKVKLKSKTKHLPKGLNVTDTSFKVKKILIREQLRAQDVNEILSRRKLNIKELITRLHHYNSSVRQEAVKELREILVSHSNEILSSQLNALLQGIAALSLDKDKSVRRDSLKALSLILTPVSNDHVEPFFGILVSYLSCAMTHIDPNVKEDSLSFLDVLSDNCGSLLAKSSDKILPNFLDMISKLRTESRPERQLTTNLSSKQTSIRWRIKVLSRLSDILTSMIGAKRSQRVTEGRSSAPSAVVNFDQAPGRVVLLKPNRVQRSEVKFTAEDEAPGCVGGDLEPEELKRFVRVLMPLMIESWIEVAPKQSANGNRSNLAISNEASGLLRTITRIMELLTEYVDLCESERGTRSVALWFDANFRATFERNLFNDYPYCETSTLTKVHKRQEDYRTVESNPKCFEQNLAISRVHVWLTAVNFSNGGTTSSRDNCLRVVGYLNDVLANWSSADNFALPQLTRCIRNLLLEASKIWYRNKVQLGSFLKTIIDIYSKHSHQELRSQLFTILTDIVTNHDLIELHGEESFTEFIGSMPNFLLKRNIHENTIKMLNRVVLQHKKLIENSLREKQQQIIENAKKINIIDSEDANRSRLAICNLFYFLDGQIYY